MEKQTTTLLSGDQVFSLFDSRGKYQKLLETKINSGCSSRVRASAPAKPCASYLDGLAYMVQGSVVLLLPGGAAILALQQWYKHKTILSSQQSAKREKEVLKLIVQEFTTAEIADRLFISQNTVDTHRKNLVSKLNVRNMAGLVKYALQNGLAD